MTRRGLTLIELLSVVVILTLVSGVTLASLAGASAESRMRATIGALRALDQKARILARSSPEAGVRLTCDGEAVRLHAPGHEGPISVVTSPPNMVIRLDAAGEPSVTFDRLGRCGDYEIEIHDREETHAIILVHGLTGLTTEPEA